MTPPRRRRYIRCTSDEEGRVFSARPSLPNALRPGKGREKAREREKRRNPISGTLTESGPEEQKGGHIESRFSREVKETNEKGKMAAAKVAPTGWSFSLDSSKFTTTVPRHCKSSLERVNSHFFIIFIFALSRNRYFRLGNKRAR